MARIFTYDSYGMYAVSVRPAGDEEPTVELTELKKKPLSPDVIQYLAEGVTPVMFVDTVTPADVLQEADVAKSGLM